MRVFVLRRMPDSLSRLQAREALVAQLEFHVNALLTFVQNTGIRFSNIGQATRRSVQIDCIDVTSSCCVRVSPDLHHIDEMLYRRAA